MSSCNVSLIQPCRHITVTQKPVLTVDMCSGFNPVVVNNRRRGESDGADDVGVGDGFLRRRTHLHGRPRGAGSRTQLLHKFLCMFVRPSPNTDLRNHQ